MPRRPLESLGATVRETRGDKNLREAAREIGISAATLMRVESGRIPDVETFGRICNWLKKDPAAFLGMKQHPEATKSLREKGPPVLTVSAHFRADHTPKPETVNALAQMVLIAMNAQPRATEIEE
jgi:transcriptional regulator with XRE-family HTH domain